jgi:predicted Zn-dependent protease
MTTTHERNTDGLIENAHRKSQNTARKVDEAIQRLIKNKEKINFNSVSTESGVSKAYLYTHPEIRERIETLRKQQEGLPSPKQVKREMTDASKDVVIAAKNKRIKELEEENKKLKDELMHLRGKIYEQ